MADALIRRTISVPLAPLSLHANYLAQGMDDFHQVTLRGHHRVDGFVGGGSFVDDASVLAAFDAFGHSPMVFDREAALGFTTGHRAPSTVAAAHETFRIAFASDNEGACAHTAGNDSQIAFLCAHGTFAGNEDFLAVVAFAGNIVVVAVDGLHTRGERAHFAGITHGFDDLFHHQVAIGAREILRPFDGFHIIVKVFSTFLEVSEVFVG